MRYYEYPVELDAMRAFYNEIGYPEGRIDYSCNTDGRPIVDWRIHQLGSLIEFKVVAKSNSDVFNQMKRYIRAYNARGLSLPKYGVYIITESQKYTVFNLEYETYCEDAVICSNLDLVVDLERKTSNADSWINNTETQKGWIDENSIVAYNDIYFSSRGKSRKKKDDFIAELANPTILNIKPYEWQPDGDMERKLLDCLGSAELKKRLGAFFTPAYAARQSTKYVRNIIRNLSEDEDYVIVDRCCGSGNLEMEFTEEELSHCILSTMVFAEKTTLKGLYEGKVKAILPLDETTDSDGCMPSGDALSEEFNNGLSTVLEICRRESESRGKKLVVIGLENPPYSEVSGLTIKGKENRQEYVTDKMKESGVNKGSLKAAHITKDIANRFIWSGFEWFFDYYVAYAPIKYWKSQHLIDKKFLEGSIVNRADFHATEGGISIIAWKNEDVNNEQITLQAMADNKVGDIAVNKIKDVVVKKIHTGTEELRGTYKKKDDGEDLFYSFIPGVINYTHCVITNDRSFSRIATGHGGFINVDDPNFKKILPLFVANCYTCKDFTEKEIIMKSGDKGTLYQEDKEFLEDCFLWCCLTDKNKCISNSTRQNEMALEQNSKADQIVDRTSDHRMALIRSWRNVITKAKACEEYNPNYKYGLAQIISDIDINVDTAMIDKNGKFLQKKKNQELDEVIKTLKAELKKFYSDYLEPKLFEYELLK